VISEFNVIGSIPSKKKEVHSNENKKTMMFFKANESGN
jgi:hypothetical protein